MTVLAFPFSYVRRPLGSAPVKTDSDKYRVVLENERVRVPEYQLILLGGKTVLRKFKPGEVMWTDAHSHIGENITTGRCRF
jgi:hypothetical protein